MDLDGDGIPDILSGSCPGELYFFKGGGQGRFVQAEVLLDKDRNPIKLGSVTTVFACDWRGTGLLDLLVGNYGGEVYLVPNLGKKTEPAFGKAEKLRADGRDLKAPGGDSHPVMADWEQSGKPGLVLACGDGSVRWYPNLGPRTRPSLGKEELLIGPARSDDRAQGPPTRPGIRAKVCMVDWNGDGKLDLLLGDFTDFGAGSRPLRYYGYVWYFERTNSR